MTPFRTPQPHQIRALSELASLTCRASGAAQIEICSRFGSTSRTLVREGFVPHDVPTFHREASTRLPIGSELVVSAAFRNAPDDRVQESLSQAVAGAAAVLGTSVLIEPGRGPDAPFALFDTAPLPMWIHDIESLRFLDVNAFAVARYGFSRDEFLRMTVADLRPREDMTGYEEPASDSPLGFSVWRNARHRWKDGTVRDVGIVSYDVSYNGRAARLVLVDDITERVRAERRQQLLQAAIENLDEIVILFRKPRDSDQMPRITFVNGAMERMLGWKPEQLSTSEGLREVGAGMERHMARALVDAVSRSDTSHLDIDVCDSEGNIHHLDCTIVPVRVPGMNDASYWAAVARDVTEQRAIADRSIQAQRLEAMGLLAGGIAHDFKNLVLAISGFSQLALKQLPEDSRAADDVRQVHAAAARAAALAQQLLAFSSRQVMSPQRVDLNDLATRLLPMLQRIAGRTIELRLHVSQPSIAVFADPTQMEQVLLNLVVNARDAQNEKGTIDIHIECATRDKLVKHFPEIAELPEQYWARICVTDRGPGIPPEVRARIFEPFFTTKSTGTGLGLSTVHGIVKQSGGHVNLFPNEQPGNTGTRAEFVLPLAEVPVDAAPDKKPSMDAQQRKETVR